jgi:hypothetical protein
MTVPFMPVYLAGQEHAFESFEEETAFHSSDDLDLLDLLEESRSPPLRYESE